MKTLLLVDIQNDFVPGGALAVPHGDEVVAIANRLMPLFDLVVATQDWHGPRHGSFASAHPGRSVGDHVDLCGLDQILWPDHCVRDTPGAALVPSLDGTRIARIFRKGTDDTVDSYSGFFDNARRRATGLGDFLRRQGATDVYVMGLATDYCVRATALDAVDLGLTTYLVLDGCRGVDLTPGDSARAVEQMKAMGVRTVQSSEVLSAAAGPARPAAAAHDG